MRTSYCDGKSGVLLEEVGGWERKGKGNGNGRGDGC